MGAGKARQQDRMAKFEEEELTLKEAQEIKDRWRYFMSRVMAFITDAPDCELAAWQASLALGTDNCIGHTMSSKAQELKVTTACISKAATKVCRMLNAPPSSYMLSEGSRGSYRELRRRQEEQRKEELKPRHVLD